MRHGRSRLRVAVPLVGRVAITAMLCVNAVGCYGGHKVHLYNPIDERQKTVSMPPGSGVVGELKKVLESEGWRTYIREQGRYTLEYAPQANISFAWTLCSLAYSITLMDNRTGKEAFALTGVECTEGGVAERFRKALHGQQD